jgi:hypothetical protein
MSCWLLTAPMSSLIGYFAVEAKLKRRYERNIKKGILVGSQLHGVLHQKFIVCIASISVSHFTTEMANFRLTQLGSVSSHVSDSESSGACLTLVAASVSNSVDALTNALEVGNQVLTVHCPLQSHVLLADSQDRRV